MAQPVVARTPSTMLRQMWEITEKAGGSSFIVLSAWRTVGWSVKPEELQEPPPPDGQGRGYQLKPNEYVGAPDPAKDLQINQRQDAMLQQMIMSLRLKAISMKGRGQEIKEGKLSLSVENSYLIPDMSLKVGEQLDRIFNQDMFIYGKPGDVTTLYGWDRAGDTFVNWATWDQQARYRGKTFDPKQGPGGSYVEEDPATSTFRSDGKNTPGVGFTFYSESGIPDALKDAAARLKAKGEIMVDPWHVEREWIDYAKEIESQVKEATDPAAKAKLQASWKHLVAQVTKNPEDMVRYLMQKNPSAQTKKNWKHAPAARSL